MYKINTNEPFWWALFMGGAGLVGMLLPIHIIVYGLAVGLSLVNHEANFAASLATFLGNPLVKLYVFGLCSLTFFHWAHRFRYFVFDLGMRGGRTAMEFICYGTAVVGTIYTAYTVFTL